jgi:hypothetical protein
MNRASVVIAMLGALLAGAQGSAVDWKNQSPAAKRQAVGMVIDCMRKRMSKDRSISYNEAAKVCKQEVARQFDSAPSGALVAADTKP